MGHGFVIVKKRKRSKLLCNFKVTRGENAGKYCPEQAMLGFSKCKKHFKKPNYRVKLVKKLEAIMAPLLEVLIHRNEFGEWEHRDTGLLFDDDTQKVIGKRIIGGSRELVSLSIYDMHYALKNGWELASKDDDNELVDL